MAIGRDLTPRIKAGALAIDRQAEAAEWDFIQATQTPQEAGVMLWVSTRKCMKEIA